MKKSFLYSITTILGLCIVIAGASSFFIHDNPWTGPLLLALGSACLLPLKFFQVKIRESIPDIIFGIIDNGILAIFAIYGGYFAGITGAILGGVVGNAITDGIAGIFEGYFAETMQRESKHNQRTTLTSSIGKMSGCLLGAGIVITIAHILS